MAHFSRAAVECSTCVDAVLIGGVSAADHVPRPTNQTRGIMRGASDWLFCCWKLRSNEERTGPRGDWHPMSALQHPVRTYFALSSHGLKTARFFDCHCVRYFSVHWLPCYLIMCSLSTYEYCNAHCMSLIKRSAGRRDMACPSSFLPVPPYRAPSLIGWSPKTLGWPLVDIKVDLFTWFNRLLKVTARVNIGWGHSPEARQQL
ncbi:hypothetical protein B0T17DRAFT_388876 [Bombardia bombarda]|uniref:Uncharacterized protein n=1 Tax=Bombardia bombarda TaxID=252184 RepID=A0AA39U5M9_9PEZI|nr:hypothetical protein B0T17DRAFT_388876 [Bombardia bombarda]